MKKILGLLVILPAICLALGYGAGEYLSKSSQDNASSTAEPDPAATDGGHGDSAAEGGHASNDAAEADHKPIIVKLGQMIIPVYKARSVTYIVTNLGVSVSDLGQAEYYNLGENGSRLRDAIFAELKISADGRALRGASIDTEKLSQQITSEVKPKFDGISDVLFLSFYKRDIARS